MKLSKFSLAAGVALGCVTVLAVTPASAQRIREAERQRARDNPQPAAPAQGQIQQLSRGENAAILPLYTAVQASDWAAATAALPAAQAGVETPYGRYVVAQLVLRIAQNANDAAGQARAVDAMLASGAAPAETIRPLLHAQVSFAIQAQNWAGAEQALTRVLELEPNDLERIRQLAEVKIHLNKRPEALALYQRALQISQTAGQTPPEEYYRRAFALASDQRQAGAAAEIGLAMLRAYPTAANWRDALVLFRQTTGTTDPALSLDLGRLMFNARALARPADYIDFADRLNRAGLPGEVKSVLEDGLSRNILQAQDASVRQLLAGANARIGEDRASLPSLRTRAMAGASGRDARSAGDAFFGYGQYADAAALYRAALQKGGEDANLVNTRLGVALVRANQRAEAEAAFRAVTGPRAPLAAMWLLWLERPAA
jgi:tetratricopeptide (TPR) repeat protein